MNATWSYEQGRIWATCGGRRIPTWTADPAHAGLVDLLNTNPDLCEMRANLYRLPPTFPERRV